MFLLWFAMTCYVFGMFCYILLCFWYVVVMLCHVLLCFCYAFICLLCCATFCYVFVMLCYVSLCFCYDLLRFVVICYVLLFGGLQSTRFGIRGSEAPDLLFLTVWQVWAPEYLGSNFNCRRFNDRERFWSLVITRPPLAWILVTTYL